MSQPQLVVTRGIPACISVNETKESCQPTVLYPEKIPYKVFLDKPRDFVTSRLKWKESLFWG